MKKYETINVSPQTKITIAKMAEKHGYSITKYMELAANYFVKTGLDPKANAVLSPAEELKKFRDTIISFLRKQESDFILPVFGEMKTLIYRFNKYIEEEAPKNESIKLSNKISSFDKKSNLSTDLKTENSNDSINRTDYIVLKREFDDIKGKHDALKDHFSDLLSKTTYKSTGLLKKPVIDLQMSEISSYKVYLRTL